MLLQHEGCYLQRELMRCETKHQRTIINIQYFRFVTVPLSVSKNRLSMELAFPWLESSRPRRMAWTAEQKRGRRAQRKRDRAADDECFSTSDSESGGVIVGAGGGSLPLVSERLVEMG